MLFMLQYLIESQYHICFLDKNNTFYQRFEQSKTGGKISRTPLAPPKLKLIYS